MRRVQVIVIMHDRGTTSALRTFLDQNEVVAAHPTDSLPGGHPSIQPGPRPIDVGFIDKFQVLYFERADQLAVLRPRVPDTRRVVLGSMAWWFWRDNRRRCSTHHLVGTRTRHPIAVAA